MQNSEVVHGGNPPAAVSLCAGAGGMDLGFSAAGFEVVAAVDNWNVACETYRLNHAATHVLAGDITTDTVKQAITGFVGTRDISVVFGGPTCAGFSQAGHRDSNDPRNSLIGHFLDVVGLIHPQVFVIENVLGMLSMRMGGSTIPEMIVGRSAGMGFSVTFHVLNAADFGVAQVRKRVIVVGRRCPGTPVILRTHDELGRDGLPRWNTFRDAVKGLPEAPQDFVHFPESRLRFIRLLKAGQNWRNLPEELKADAMGGALLSDNGGRTSYYKRLAWDRPAPTLLCSPLQKMTCRAHPDEDRPLSVQEYARIQGLPDGYRLSGRIADMYRQIGNMVPTPMAQAVAGAVMRMLTGAAEEATLPATAVMPITVVPDHTSSRISKNNNTKGERTMKTKQTGKLTDDQVQEIAKTYVAKFNARGEGNMRTQLELGRLVDEYVDKVTDGGRTRKDAFKVLQGMPESAHRTSQLRQIRGVYRLYHELGGDSLFKGTSLSLTTFILVLPSHIGNEHKKAILLKAAADRLTVAETRKLLPPSHTKRATNPAGQVFQNKIHNFATWLIGVTTALQEGTTTLTAEEIGKLANLNEIIGRVIEVCSKASSQQEELPLAA